MMKQDEKRVLYYPGCGWDNCFLDHSLMEGIDKVIIVDRLPRVPHYEEGKHEAYEKTKDLPTYIQTLTQSFGDPIKRDDEKNLLIFEHKYVKEHIYYYHSTDDTSIPESVTDILYRGYYQEYSDEQWEKIIATYNVFFSCCSCMPEILKENIDFIQQVHIEHNEDECPNIDSDSEYDDY